MYMTLHAETEIDLVEKQHQEIQFRQATGDFGLLQGKFMLQAEDHEVQPGQDPQQFPVQAKGLLLLWGAVCHADFTLFLVKVEHIVARRMVKT